MHILVRMTTYQFSYECNDSSFIDLTMAWISNPSFMRVKPTLIQIQLMLQM